MLLEGYNRHNLMIESLDIIPELVEETIQAEEEPEYKPDLQDEDKVKKFTEALLKRSVDYNEVISDSLELLYEAKIQTSMFTDNTSIERRINTLIETVLPKDNKIMLNLTKGNQRSRNIQRQQETSLKNVTPAVSLITEEDIFI